jgi:predicted ATPase/DNA-binding winged helix-turn-helix (wHTH) protein
MGAPQWLFEPFRLDPVNARLWRGAEAVALQPRVFDVLHYLVTHPNRLVTKDELLDAVWPETAVSEAVVRVAIGALRKALDDTTRTPRFIATVPRRGYRFVAPVTGLTPPAPTPTLPSPPRPLLAPPLLVEREAVSQHLHAAWQQACQGVRQVVFVTGEAGMGKTAVVETLAAQVRTDPTVGLATGQCVEHYGTGEAYLPILEALGSLCQGPRGADLVAILRQHAPTWLVQMPWLLTAADRESLQHELQGTTRERMLREFAAVVEALTAAMPLLLVLEDLHWSDYATVDLLAMLARRCPHARLLVVGTYRPVETLVHQHPLHSVTLDLQRHESTTVLSLVVLSAEAVASYLAARFPQHQFPTALAVWLHQRTDGHPLFLVTLVQALVERGVLCTTAGGWTMPVGLDALNGDVPERLRQLLRQQILRLPPESQRVLEVASVAGVEFVAAAVAVGIEADADAVEERCETLVAQELLCPLGVTTWPNGVMATRYAFRHGLYQQVVYQGLGAGRRVRLHQRLGGYLEAAYGAQVGEIAAELAEHFVRGQDTQHAVSYLRQAAENAAQRYAHREVIDLLTRALALLTQLPETSERTYQELEIQLALGPVLMAIKGHGAPEVGQAYARARTLCQQLGDTPQLFPTLQGLFRFYHGRGEYATAGEVAEQLYRLAQHEMAPTSRLEAHYALGRTLHFQGEFVPAWTHLEQGIALIDLATQRTRMFHDSETPGSKVSGHSGAHTVVSGLSGTGRTAESGGARPGR